MEQNKYFLPLSVLAAGLLIAGAVVYNGSSPRDTSGAVKTYNIKDVKIAGEPFVGSTDAPVTIAVFSDFQCPFCRQFEVGGVAQLTKAGIQVAFPDLMKQYVSTGKVRLVFKDVVFLGDDSLTAHLYSQSVWKLHPGQYLVWRHAMLTAQDEGQGGFGNAASVDKLNATIPGLDAAKVAADVVANRTAYEKRANEATKEAQALGVTGTPNFIVGKQLLNGAVPFSAFQAAIDPLLK